jgi:carboxyl-terminal processing protease
MYKDSVAIIRPIENGPRLKGNTSWDRILYADKTKLFGRKLPSDSLFSKLKGEQGSVVELTIYRKSVKKQIIKNKRGVIPLKVSMWQFLNDSTGYIKSIVLQKQPLKNLKKA